MNYSLREIKAYLGAIARSENADDAKALLLTALAAQGRAKDIVKTVRELQRR